MMRIWILRVLPQGRVRFDDVRFDDMRFGPARFGGGRFGGVFFGVAAAAALGGIRVVPGLWVERWRLAPAPPRHRGVLDDRGTRLAVDQRDPGAPFQVSHERGT